MRRQAFEVDCGEAARRMVEGYIVVPGLFGVYKNRVLSAAVNWNWRWRVTHLPTGLNAGKKEGYADRASAAIIADKLSKVRAPWHATSKAEFTRLRRRPKWKAATERARKIVR